MRDFPTKTALITGAAKRIGRASAMALAADGWQIGVHYGTSAHEAESLISQIEQEGGKAIALCADLGEAAAAADLIPRAAEALGGISLLINNASLFEPDDATTLTPDSWNAHLNINLRAPALLMQAFAAQDIWSDNSDACIINITDQRIDRLTPYFTSYSVSKVGLWTLTQTFAQALAPKHIRVNAIAPGPVLPNVRQSQAAYDKQASLVPLQHGATPDDIVQAIRFILSAHALTGESIAIDGGQHIAWQTPDTTLDS